MLIIERRLFIIRIEIVESARFGTGVSILAKMRKRLIVSQLKAALERFWIWERDLFYTEIMIYLPQGKNDIAHLRFRDSEIGKRKFLEEIYLKREVRFLLLVFLIEQKNLLFSMGEGQR